MSGFGNEVANPTDLQVCTMCFMYIALVLTSRRQNFLSQARPDFPNGTFAVQTVDGGSDDGQGTAEAVRLFILTIYEALLMPRLLQSLDIQYTVGVATNVNTTFISVGQKTQDGDLDGFLDIINTLLAMDSPPLVLTTSFGFDETAFSQQAPEIAE